MAIGWTSQRLVVTDAVQQLVRAGRPRADRCRVLRRCGQELRRVLEPAQQPHELLAGEIQQLVEPEPVLASGVDDQLTAEALDGLVEVDPGEVGGQGPP
jgi:hypothetical protein